MPRKKKQAPDNNNRSVRDKNNAVLLKRMPVFYEENGQQKTGRIAGFIRSVTNGVESIYVVIGTSKIPAGDVEKTRQ